MTRPASSPKMVREALCAAQGALNERARQGVDTAATPGWVAELGALIAAVDTHRPLGRDGKHGDLHTDTCGCEGRKRPWALKLRPGRVGLAAMTAQSSYALCQFCGADISNGEHKSWCPVVAPDPDREIDARFEYLRGLMSDLDGYSGPPLQLGVEDRARSILTILRNLRPHICMTVEGGIFLTWPDEDDTEAITISVQPDGGIEASFGDAYLEMVDDG